MAQIVNMPMSGSALFGQAFGSGLSSGLASTIDQMLAQKTQQMQDQSYNQQLDAAGLNPEFRKILPFIPMDQRGKLFQSALEAGIPIFGQQGGYQGGAGVEGAQQQQAPNVMSKIDEILSQNQQQQGALQALQGLQQPTTEQQNLQRALFNQVMGGQQQGSQQDLSQISLAAQIKELLSQAQQPQQQMPMAQGQSPMQAAAGGALSPFQQQWKAAADAKNYQKQRIDIEKEKMEAKEQADIRKETNPFIKEIYNDAKGSKDSNIRLDQMEQLVQKGNLPNPIFASAIKTLSNGIFGFGLDISAIQGADAEQFDKLSSDFIKNAKSVFGSRITDADLKAFMKTVPNLTQSDEGKMRLINNLRLFNEAAVIKKNALDEILRENQGKRPRDLETMLEDRTAKPLDELKDKFSTSVPTKEQDRSKKRFSLTSMSYQ